MLRLVGEPVGVEGFVLVFGFERGEGFGLEEFGEFLREGVGEVILYIKGGPGVGGNRASGAIAQQRIWRWCCDLGSMVRPHAS